MTAMNDMAALRSKLVTTIRKWMIRYPFLLRITHFPALAWLRRLTLGRRPSELAAGAPTYEDFRQTRIAECEGIYPDNREPGLLCFVTTVWNTAPEYLTALAESLFSQRGGLEFEWLLVDNGSTDQATRECLAKIATHPIVRFERVEKNLGIIGGMRYCLERAHARYILPLDSDDTLYPQCVSIITHAIQSNNYPALLYTDEDKLEGNIYRDPYYKPDWDPVLFVNSCYIAHLCAIDRMLALKLDCYGDRRTEGSHDWDSFTRFMLNGYKPVHISEVVYSWRMHPQSTAGNFRSKPVIYDSQSAVLLRFLEGSAFSGRFDVVPSPLFPGTPDWWIKRKSVDPRPIIAIALGSSNAQPIFDRSYPADFVEKHRAADVKELRAILMQAPDDALVHLQDSHVKPEGDRWAWEAIGQFELFPDCAMVGGRILSLSRHVLSASQYFGFGNGCDSPDQGRHETDYGYFAKLVKPHSASAVSAKHCFVTKRALLEAIELSQQYGARDLTMLGAWCGLSIRKTGSRVIYSPYIIGICQTASNGRDETAERLSFLRAASDFLPETSYLSRHLGLTLATNYRAVPQAARKAHLEHLQAGTRPADR